MDQEKEDNAKKQFKDLSNKVKTEKQMKGLTEKIGSFLQYFGGDVQNALKTFAEMLEAHWKGYKKLEPTTLATIVGVLLYVATPIDAIPDSIPILGFMDDAFIIKYAMNQLHVDINNFREWKEENGEQIVEMKNEKCCSCVIL